MTNVLIVDDDPGQLRTLARIIAARRRDFSVVTAGNGTQAIDQLRSSNIDVVLTDLEMPEMSGFELLTWLASNQPQIPVFTMTAYPDVNAVHRLRGLGAVDCFTKPLDVGSVLTRLSGVLSEGIRGHVRNIHLASLLQLIEMERKTCMLAVESGDRNGVLHLHEGKLVDARTAELSGNEAVVCIVAWRLPAITLMRSGRKPPQTITRSLSFLLMEAMRLRDEAMRDAHEPIAGADDTTVPIHVPEPGRTPLSVPRDAAAVAIVDSSSGEVLEAAGELEGLEGLSKVAASIFGAEEQAVARLRLEDTMSEMVLTSKTHWIVVRRVGSTPESLVVLVFDPLKATLVMERRALDELVTTLATQCSRSAAVAEPDETDWFDLV